MGTMNFSIPDDVKEKFNETFDGQNKSAVVTELLKRAIEDEERRRQSLSLLERMRKIRDSGPLFTDEEFRAVRDELRT